ncbi:MAG: SurA N-terminal domain-containing protein [Thermodesulfobacteriota bacterium]
MAPKRTPKGPAAIRARLLPLAVSSLLCLTPAFWGCSKEEKKPEPVCLVQVGQSCMTRTQFDALFGTAASGLTAQELSDEKARAAAKERYLECVAEEMLVLERARELSVTVSEKELDKAVSDIAEDYPDNTFLSMFTEQAISFSTWREALRRRLIMDKVIFRELTSEGRRIQAKEGRIAAGAPGPYTETELLEPAASGPQALTPDSQTITESEQEIEEEYSAWLEKLKARYPVVVRKELLAAPAAP